MVYLQMVDSKLQKRSLFHFFFLGGGGGRWRYITDPSNVCQHLLNPRLLV